MRHIVLPLALFLALSTQAAWFKGNTHTHTLESDGDSTPADVVRWYAEHGYDFLVITDHDKVTRASADGLVLIPGEEITDRLPGKPLHVNAIGIEEAIPPQGGASPVDVLRRNVAAVRKGGGIAAINHPNFGWAFGLDELLQVDGATLLEIASGHPYVNMAGPPSVEEMWDGLLTAGRRLWGVAVDDSHHLRRPWDRDIAPPGKAWIVVRAARREAKQILAAIAAGDFYASTGVELEDCAAGDRTMDVRVREKNGARYVIRFIGANGRLLQETEAAQASYTFRGDEPYVRAKVLDSNGKAAWCQPTFVRSRSSSR